MMHGHGASRALRVSLMGFGNVGRTLARLIALDGGGALKKYGFRLEVVAVGDSSGVVYKDEGFSSYELLKLVEAPRSQLVKYWGVSVPRASLSLRELYEELKPDIHVELTPSEYTRGEPGISNVVSALNSGASVVLANKAPLVLAFDEIISLARSKGLSVRFRATVMGGTPLIDMLLSLKSQAIRRVQGILNATTNFILTEMHKELVSLEEALKKAQLMGIAESDPWIDISGLDAAAKLVIISHVIGKPLKLDNIVRAELSLDTRRIIEALKRGRTVKYVATLDADKRVGSVMPREIPSGDLLARVSGTLNGVRIETSAGSMVVIGKGAGKVETAHSVLDDIILIGEEIRGEA